MEQLGALISFMGVTMIARPTTFFHRTLPHAPPAEGSTDAAASHTHKIGVADLNDVTTSQRVGAIFVALIGVIGSSMAFVAMRWIGKRAHPLLSVNYFCAWCTVVSASAMVILPDVKFLLPSGSREWTYLVFLGCCGFAMQFLLSAGLQSEKGNRGKIALQLMEIFLFAPDRLLATLMTYTQMIFALIFDKVIFGHNPSITSMLGSVLIVTSAMYIALQKANMKQRAQAEKDRQPAGSSTVGMTEVRRAWSPPRRRSTSLHIQHDEEQGLVEGIEGTDVEATEGGLRDDVSSAKPSRRSSLR